MSTEGTACEVSKETSCTDRQRDREAERQRGREAEMEGKNARNEKEYDESAMHLLRQRAPYFSLKFLGFR